VANVFDPQTRGVSRVPFFLEREYAQQQVKVAGHFARAALARGPDLGGHVLHERRIPIRERPLVGADISFQGMAEPPVKPGEINTYHHIRLTLNRLFQEFVQEAPELEILLQHFNESDYRVTRHIKSEVHARFPHAWPPRAEKSWRKAGMERLKIGIWKSRLTRQLRAQRLDEFSAEQITAGLASDEHEGFWFHVWSPRDKRD